MDRAISKSVIASARGIPPFWIAAMCIGYALVVFNRRTLNDGDTYWHIMAGTWMLEHHTVPQVDPFSYTFAGRPWVAHEWLSEVLMALAYQAGAWNGILILYAAAAATTCAVLARYLARWLDQPAATVVFVLGVACVGSSLLARPHLLALTALTVWSISLMSAKDKCAAPSLLLLPLMTIWANLHGSFVFGFALVVPIGLQAVVEAGTRRVAVARRWFIFLLGALGASLVTPHGWHGLLFPFQLMGMASNANIAEWAPTSFKTFLPLEGALMALLYIAFTRNVRLDFDRIVILLGLLYLALAHSRHQMVAGLVGAVVLAKPLRQALDAGSTTNDENARSRDGGWIGVGIACMAIMTVVRLMHPLERADDRASPVTALNHVPPEIRDKPVLNSYEFGGYLIFRHVKPFIDGRADLYGDDYISAYLAAFAPNRAAFTRMIDQYHIRWALLAAGSPVGDMIEGFTDWRRLYADDTAVVYVHDGQERALDSFLKKRSEQPVSARSTNK